MKSTAREIYAIHSKGKVVVARAIIAHILSKFNMKVHRSTVGRLMKKMGFIWSAVKIEQRSYASYRSRSIRDYLIALDRYVKLMARGEGNYVFIFTDESYININHACGKTYSK